MRLRQQSGAHQHKARQPLSQCVAVVPTVLMDPAMGRTAQCHHHSTPQPPTLVQTVHIPGRAVSHTRSDPSLAAAAATAGVKSAPGATETTTSAPTSEAAATTRAKAASPAKSKNEASAGKSAVVRGRAAAAATAKNAPAAKEEESAPAAKPASRANRAKESRTAARATREGRRARRDAAKSATGAAGAVVAAARETMGESGFATRRTSRMGIRSADGRRAEHIRAFNINLSTISTPIHVLIQKKKNYILFSFTHILSTWAEYGIARRFAFSVAFERYPRPDVAMGLSGVYFIRAACRGEASRQACSWALLGVHLAQLFM
jgi:hypothetical protein